MHRFKSRPIKVTEEENRKNRAKVIEEMLAKNVLEERHTYIFILKGYNKS